MPALEPNVSVFQRAVTEARAEQSPIAETPLVDDPSSTEPEIEAPPDEIPASSPVVSDAEPDPIVTPTDDFLSDTEVAALEAKHPDDPKALAKAFKAAYTRKTTEHARQIEIAHDLETDPIGTVTALAQTLGLSIAPTATERQDAATTQTAQTIADTMADRVKAVLGPDYDFMAKPLADAMRLVAEETAKAVVASQVDPIRHSQQEILSTAAKEKHTAVWSLFETKHPDWKAHEQAMVELGQKIQPSGMAEGDYLDLLYGYVTRDHQIAAGVTKQIEKMKQGAKTAQSATRSVSEKVISTEPEKIRSFRDAYQSAKAEHARG